MNQKMIWGATVVLAVLIVIGAVVLARKDVVPSAEIKIPPVAEVTENISVPVQSLPEEEKIVAVEETPKETLPAPVLPEVVVDLSRIVGALQIRSPDIPGAGKDSAPRYPLDLTCYRKNASPEIIWSNAPKDVQSYVLVLERRAPGEKASWGWVMYNIPATRAHIPGNIKPGDEGEDMGYFGQNVYGHNSYTGPCEPRGTFLYVIRLFALDTKLSLERPVTTETILPALSGHIIDAAEIRVQHYLRM